MKDLKNDFTSFATDDSPSASPRLLQKIQQKITASEPSVWTVALKLASIHGLSTLLTMTSCSQFGLRLFNTGHDLMHVFMDISPTFCEAFCGGYYLALTFLLARFILKREEWYVLLRKRSLGIASICLISLGGFSAFSHTITWTSALVWLFGASLSAELMTHGLPFNSRLKKLRS